MALKVTRGQIQKALLACCAVLFTLFIALYNVLGLWIPVQTFAAAVAGICASFFFLHLLLGKISCDVLVLVGGMSFVNLLGLLFSPYELKAEYFFYRLFPLFAAWFVAQYLSTARLRQLLVGICLLNVAVGLAEYYFRTDFWQVTDELFYADAVAGTVRANGLFWYSLAYSSFLLFAGVLLAQLDGVRVSLFFLMMLLLGCLVSFNKMNSLVLLGVILFYGYLRWGVFSLKGTANKLASFFMLLVVGCGVCYGFDVLGKLDVVLDMENAANSARIISWGQGVSEFLQSDLLGVIAGLKLGIAGKYGGGFESQYIQFLAEYGLLGVIVLVVLLWRPIRYGEWVVVLAIMLCLTTVRALDSYGSAFIIYLIIMLAPKGQLRSLGARKGMLS